MLSCDNEMTIYMLKAFAWCYGVWSNSGSFRNGGWPGDPVVCLQTAVPEPFV